MRVLVTGANGKVGGATVTALIERGHEVPSTDRQRGVFERPDPGAAEYTNTQADLIDAGDAYAVTRDMEAVVHSAAIPERHTEGLPGFFGGVTRSGETPERVSDIREHRPVRWGRVAQPHLQPL